MGWLKRELEENRKIIDSWPAWKQRLAGREATMSEVLSEKDLADIEQEVRDNTIYPPRFGAYIASLLASHRALQRRVEWTTSRPDREGFYWYKRLDIPAEHTSAAVLEVRKAYGKLMVVEFGYGDESPFYPLENYNQWWAGPIPPPHEARG